MTHICVNRLTVISSDKGLSPGRRQAIIWTNAGILLIGTLGTDFSEILIEIRAFSFQKMHLKMSSGKWRPFCLGLNVLTLDILNQCHGCWNAGPVSFPSKGISVIKIRQLWDRLIVIMGIHLLVKRCLYTGTDPWPRQESSWSRRCKIYTSLSSMGNDFDYPHHIYVGNCIKYKILYLGMDTASAKGIALFACKKIYFSL